MKTWIRRTLVAVAGATLLVGGLTACQHRPHGMFGHTMTEEDAAKFKARVVERVAGKLDLDAAQKQRLDTLAEAMRNERQAVFGPLGSTRDEVRALVAGTQFDRDKARALFEAKTAAVAARGPALITAFADFYDSLRPEQQARLREFMDRRHRG